MTFDDGLLKVYEVSNNALPGDMPVEKLTQKAEYYYHVEQIGVTRYYAALEADQEISAIVDIPGWEDVKTTDMVLLDGEDAYSKVSFTQTATDENGLKILRITLEKVEQKYELPG